MERTALKGALRRALLIALLAPCAARAESSSVVSIELGAIVSHSGEAGWSLDRALSQTNQVGVEGLTRLSGSRGDILSADVQARASYDPARPDGDWGIEIHNAWVEHKLGLGRSAIAGHFEPAFGLERALDTHATLLQSLAMDAVGEKHDWGAGYRSVLGPFDLEAALQTGSGMGIDRRDGSFVVSARASTPQGRGARLGFSGLHGRILESMSMRTIPAPVYSPDAVERSLVGADAEWAAGVLTVLVDAAAGRVGGAPARGGLLQIGAPAPGFEALTLEGQARAWWEDRAGADPALALIACASLRVTAGWTLRAALARTAARGTAPGETQVVFQAYYFGGIS